MRKLTSVLNHKSPDANNPKGSIQDKTASILGTQLGETLFGDIIQFFQRCVTLAGITENENPDNVSNGYQLIEAVAKSLGNTFEAYIDGGGAIIKSKGVENYTITQEDVGIYSIDQLLNVSNVFQRYKIDAQIIQGEGTTYSRAVIYQPSGTSAIQIRCYDTSNTLVEASFFLTITKF